MTAAARQPEELSGRLIALDCFRGATIGAMILVNNPGSWSHVYPPLRHAAWHGCTPTDLIFPFFLFIVGVAMAYSLPRHLKDGRPGVSFWVRVGRRVALLIALGLLLNAFMPVWKSLAAWDWRVARDQFSSIRLFGVLQRIGLVYLLACVLIVWTRTRTQMLLCAGVLIAYPLAFVLHRPDLPFAEADNLARSVDRWLIPDSHLYNGSATDPEGLLSTLPATVSVMIGYWCGLWMRRHTLSIMVCGRLAGVGVALIALGWLSAMLVPLNKPLWTSSYVIYTGGWALACLAICLLLFDLLRSPGRGALALLGRHAITVFVGSGLLARVLILLPGPGQHGSAKGWIASWPGVWLDPLNASLAFAIGTVVVWWLIAWGLDRTGIVLKV